MSRPSFLWRLVMRAERYLPKAPVGVTEPVARKRRDWTMWLALVPAMLTPLTVALSRGTGASLRAAWPMWRPMLLDLTLIAAGAALVAAIVAGVVTWRRQKERTHA